MVIISCGKSSDGIVDTDANQVKTELLLIGQGANLVPTPEFASTALPILSDRLSQPDGSNHDCQNMVPCAWTSSSQQAVVSITRADNIATRSRLTIDYTITTFHDSNLLITRAGNATLPNDTELSSSELIFAGESISKPHQTTAGNQVPGTVTFSDSTDSNIIYFWELSFLDGGTQRSASFSSIPVGTRAQYQADCQYQFPCRWTDEERSIDVTLLEAIPQQTNKGIEITFAIRTAVEENIYIAPGSSAQGIDNTTLDALDHSLGDLRSLDKLASETTPGTQLMGNITFYPTTRQPTGLDSLHLNLHNDSTNPHWNPHFINISLDN